MKTDCRCSFTELVSCPKGPLARVLPVVCAAGLAAIPSFLVAATVTWDGGSYPVDSSVNWSSALNWDTDVVPVTGDSLVFAGSYSTTTNNDLNTASGGSVVLGGMTFDASASTFDISGNALYLDGKTITNNSSLEQHITAQIQSGAAGFTVNCAVGDVSIGALQDFGASFNYNLTKNGTGTLYMSGPLVGADTYKLVVNSGMVVASWSGNIFYDGTVAANSTLKINTTATNGMIHNGGKWTVNGTLDLSGGVVEDIGDITGSGLITNHGLPGSTATLRTRQANDRTFSGVIQDGPGGGKTALDIGISGRTEAKTFTLSGANTYTGNTTFQQAYVKFVLASAGKMRFAIGASGVNNKITAITPQTAGGSTALNGTFVIDLTAAAPIDGDAWTLVDVANLNETFGSTFNLKAWDGFTETAFTETAPGSGIWTFSNASGDFQFAKATGVLSFGRIGLTTWTGGSAVDANWSTSDNWDQTPVSNDALIFDGSLQTTNTNDLDTDYDTGTSTPGTFSISSIQFAPTASAFTLQGNAIDFASRTITNNSPNTQTFETQIQIDKAVGGLTVNTAAGDVVINSLSTRNGFSTTLTKTGPATLYLHGPLVGPDTFAPNVSQGMLVADWNGGNLFYHVTVASGATLRTGGTATYGVIHNGGTVTLNGTLDLASGVIEDVGNLTGSGTITNHGAAGTTSTIRVRSSSDKTFSGPITDGSSGGATALDIGLDPTRTESGILTLSGTNTFTGNITFHQTQASLVLAATGALKFAPGANGVCNKITALAPQVAGLATLNGTFNIDLTGADVTNGNSWMLVDVANLNETFGGTFTIPGFTKSGTAWTKTAGDNTWTFEETTGVLSLHVAGVGFSSWIASFGLASGDQDPGDDPDGDGLSNLVEYALAGMDPGIADTMPDVLSGLTVTFTKRPEAVANGDVSYAIETSGDLGDTEAWAPVTPTVNNATTISYTFPGTDPKDFARLKVSNP